MVSMKITLSAAMRARDVSRPREEQLAEAAGREESLARPALAVEPPTPAQVPPPAPQPRRRDR